MNRLGKASRLLGFAFLLQFITSFLNGVVIREALIDPENIVGTMETIAGNPGLMMSYILLDVITALGIIFLGAVLYLTLKKENQNVALVALGFYLLEAALLAVSRSGAFALLQISQEFVHVGGSAALESLAALALGSMDFVGMTLHSFVFGIGAILFYSLLYTSRTIPRGLSLWGLIAVIPVWIGSALAMFGVEVPFLIYVPYVPFEFAVGIWILIKGVEHREVE